MGDRANVLKNLGIYYTIGNISSIYQSKVYGIQLAGIVESSLVKKYGLETIITR